MSADVRDKYKVRQVTEEDTIPKPEQEGGMRLAYDTTLPSIMGKLTGEKGELVDMGVHKNAKGVGDYEEFEPKLYTEGRGNGAEEAHKRARELNKQSEENGSVLGYVGFIAKEVDGGAKVYAKKIGSPVFKDKSNVTGRAYNLANLDQHRATLLFADPFGFQLVKSSFVIAAREAGNLGRFTNRIVKQWGKWIADHAKALWQAAAKGANAVGEYLKSLAPSSAAANTRMGMAQAEGPRQVSRAGAIAPSGTVNRPQLTEPLEPPKEKGLAGKALDKLNKAHEVYLKPVLSVADSIHQDVGNLYRLHGREENVVQADAQKRTDLAFQALKRVEKSNAQAQELWLKIDKPEHRAEVVAMLEQNGATPEEVAQFKSLFGPNGTFQHFLKERRAAGLELGEVGTDGQDYFPRKVRADRLTEFQQYLYDSELRRDVDPMVNEMMREKIETFRKNIKKEITETNLSLQKAEKDGNTRLAEREGHRLLNKRAAKEGEIAKDEFFSRDEKIQMQGMALRRMIQTHGKGASMKGRRIDQLEAKLAGFYEKPSEALRNYISEQARAVPAARIFGPKAYETFKNGAAKDADLGDGAGSDLLDINTPFGKTIFELKEAGKLSVESLNKIREMTQGVLGHMPPGEALRWVKDFNMISAIGNPISALRQLPSEAALAAAKYGIKPTFRVALKRLMNGWQKAGMIDPERDMHIAASYEIAHRGDKLGRVATWLAKWSGFKRMDQEAAGVLVNSRMQSLQDMSEAERIREISQFRNVLNGTDKDAALRQASKDIKEGHWTEPNVLNLAHFFLSQDRPTGLASMPLGYLQAKGIGQIPYNLRGWGLFDFERHRHNIWDNLRSSDPAKRRQGVAYGVYILSAMVLAGAGADQAVDWLLGKNTSFGTKVEDNLLKFALASRYQVNNMLGERPDIKGSILNYMSTPALDVLSAVAEDAVKAYHDDEKTILDTFLSDKRSLRLVPLGIGTIAKARFMGGAQEDAAKAIDKSLPKPVLQLTEEANKLRAIGEDQRKKSPLRQKRWEHLTDFGHIKSWHVKLAKEAAERGDYIESDAQLEALDRVARNPHRWSGESARIARLKKARERLEKAS
jgi:hypothetical protein